MHYFINILLLIIVGILIFYIIKRNNINRRENLNIIRKKDRLYFYLSDDFFFSVKLNQDSKLNKGLLKAIKEELKYIKKSIRSVNFINFRNKNLEDELNSIIQKNRD